LIDLDESLIESVGRNGGMNMLIEWLSSIELDISSSSVSTFCELLLLVLDTSKFFFVSESLQNEMKNRGLVKELTDCIQSPLSLLQQTSSSSNQQTSTSTTQFPFRSLSLLLNLSQKSIQVLMHFSNRYEKDICDSVLISIVSLFRFHKQLYEIFGSKLSLMKEIEQMEIDFLRLKSSSISFLHSLSGKTIFSSVFDIIFDVRFEMY
jgi:hypothetical protein